MYKEFYNLKENPFSVTSDPGFFFSSNHHMEAYSHLIYGIQQRKGIMIMTGEIGTGKTTICRALLSHLDPNIKTAFILNPYFSEIQLLQLILKDLGIAGNFRNKLSLIDALNAFLLEQSSLGNNVVIIIDEAQDLNVRQLEQVRLLSNLETEKTKLLQIVLVGQPELLHKLKLSSLRQLTQRITVRYHVLPLKQPEVNEYISHRIKLASKSANGKSALEFTPDALEAIYLFSRGTPRLINILCDRALLSGFVAETKTIDQKIIYKCAREIG